MNAKGLLRSRFLRDSATLQLGAMCLAFGSLLGLIALTHILGANGQGEFYIAIAIYSFLWLLTGLGLYPVVISHVAKASARDDKADVAAWLAYLGKGTAILALGTLALAWFGLPAAVEYWLGADLRDPDRMAHNAIILCVIPLVEVPRLVGLAGLTGTRRMASVARVENGQEACRVLLVVVGALVTGDARGPVVGMVLASCLGSLLAVEAWVREARQGHVPSARAVFDARHALGIRAGLREGIQMGLVRNIDAYGVQILPALILGHFGTASWVAYLRTAQRFTDMARMLMQGISRTALPVLSELRGVKSRGRLRSVYWRASLLSGMTVGLGLLLGLPLAPTVLERLLPPNYADPVWRCLLILLPGVIVVGFSVANDTFYLVTGTLKVGIALSLVGLVVNTGVVALLAWSMPTVGVAYGLSFTFLWSLVHVLYAAFWFHRHVSRDGGELQNRNSPHAEESGLEQPLGGSR